MAPNTEVMTAPSQDIKQPPAADQPSKHPTPKDVVKVDHGPKTPAATEKKIEEAWHAEASM